jgi:hypothetical protein
MGKLTKRKDKSDYPDNLCLLLQRMLPMTATCATDVIRIEDTKMIIERDVTAAYRHSHLPRLRKAERPPAVVGINPIIMTKATEPNAPRQNSMVQVSALIAIVNTPDVDHATAAAKTQTTPKR